ncbi:Aste57867_21140 [Aphanomyces stellatus]|uniref:Aste57867_21140 protein n=1 Tax=Aphanomyces stellatus TaxID=120398 RepID=A0A485LGU2_9STRA|nr:hypothetical protein As57867_021072 [Aphanomyces stellatus]VFT97814.1 Aste57867_21140 [Aphanomyces stellatus]
MVDASQCQYVYKTCTNARSVKKDGSAHRLCAFHRQKANALQKVYATKRRREMRTQRKALVVQRKQQKELADALKAADAFKVEPIALDEPQTDCDDDFSIDDFSILLLDDAMLTKHTTLLADEDEAYFSQLFATF